MNSQGPGLCLLREKGTCICDVIFACLLDIMEVPWSFARGTEGILVAASIKYAFWKDPGMPGWTL